MSRLPASITEYNVVNAWTQSSAPVSPFNRFRLNRTYQLVSCSMNLSNFGMTRFKWYVSISFRTELINDWQYDRIHWSMILIDWPTSSSLNTNVVFVSI